jgi:integrase
MRGQGRIYRREGSPFWWCAYYLRGRQFRQSTEQIDEKKAQKFLDRKLKEIHADQIGARPFVGPQQERITVSELLDALEADYKLRKKDSPQFKAHLKPIREYFGTWRALEVTAEAVDKFITELLQSKAPATVNRSTQLLTQAYQLAIDRRRLSSVPSIRHLSEKGNERQGFFTDLEFRKVVEHLPVYLQDFARFGYLTGWRKGEIASLRWQDVEGDVIRLRAENSKNGEARKITLNGELEELLERRKVARHIETKTGALLAELVFHHDGNPIVDMRKAWAAACKMAGVQGRLFHDLRRTAVRNMVRAGVPEKVAMSISGHKTRSIFDRYNIVSEADLREAMQKTQTYLIATAEDERKRQPAEIQRVQ